MNLQSDAELARKIYRQLNQQQNYDAANNVRSADLNSTQNLVSEEWELRDPTPDVQSLFKRFDERFFKNKLQCVTLEWSKKMYSCAGICYQRSNKFGKECKIRLSEPLLKLRSRKDLIETLLHEMIHAYCFVQGIREGNGGHGPTFISIMRSINKITGTNITVYHTFYNEVNAYKTHIWRCNGICQHRRPFYGYVKRTCNRAPGPTDYWWMGHKQSCGGYFEKIGEPEKPQKKTSGKKVHVLENKDIRSFFPTFPQKSPKPIDDSESVRANVRNAWQKKSQSNEIKTSPNQMDQSLHKKTSKAHSSQNWNQIDEDVFIENVKIPVINLDDTLEVDGKHLTPLERQNQIKEEILESSQDSSDIIELIDDEFDDEDLTTINTVLDESVIEDLFGKDTLMDEFNQRNCSNHEEIDKSSDLITCPVCELYLPRDVMSSHMEGCLGIIEHVKLRQKCAEQSSSKRRKISSHTSTSSSSRNDSHGTGVKKNSNYAITLPNDSLVSCPVCNKFLPESRINDHLDTCLIKENTH
uniref:Protein with SprT-like domain at the N terminus n=1 Tax=Phlebotomus papatasi TaxID=29031 RepID=A0A1B0DH28_PHLPP